MYVLGATSQNGEIWALKPESHEIRLYTMLLLYMKGEITQLSYQCLVLIICKGK